MQDEPLVLEILKQDIQLAMSIFEKDELASTLRRYSKLAVSFEQINKLCAEITSILNKADNEDLKKTSQLLWDQLFTKTVKDKLKASAPRDLMLFLDEELINIPWELLYDGKDFLCLKFNLGRLVRTKEQLAPVRYRSTSGKLKMLILANPTADLKSAYLEGTYIKNQFDSKRREVSIDFKSTQIDTLYVKKNLRDYDIVHFAGHCEYDLEDPRSSGWVLADGRFTAQDILAMGEAMSMPALVFSNACHSAKASPDSIDADYQAKSYSLAGAFLFSGTRHYIGAIRKIEDPASLTFAKEFYSRLISGKSVGECMRLGRSGLIKEYGIINIHWMSYLLYGDPEFRLFRARPKPQVAGLKDRFSYAGSKKLIARIVLAAGIVSIFIYLYNWLPTLNPSTYFLFNKSRKLLFKGENDHSIALSEKILQKEPLFLSAYPILADAYQRLGKRDEALRVYFDYALYSQRKNDEKHLISAYLGIGWTYLLKGEHSKAFDFYNKAMALSNENKDALNQATSMRRLAEWHTDIGEYDAALELLTKSSEINRLRQHIYEHRYNLACDYFDIGLVFINKDDFAAAREFYGKSRILFERLKLDNELSDCYFNIGETYFYEKQYQKALDYYLQGLSIDKQQDNKPNIASGYNMIGELYVEMDSLEEAEKFFRQSVLVSKDIDAQPELAAAYRNLGLLYKKKGRNNKAREYLRKAQEIYYRLGSSLYQEIKTEFSALESPP